MTAARGHDVGGGRAHRAVEPLHAHTYFAAETEAHLVAAGLRPGRMCYFAGRAAPMGAVDAGVVTATFYSFNPDLVQRSVPRAWGLASPAAVVAARWTAVDASLRRLLGDDVVASPEVVELGGLLRRAADACTPEGRPLYAGHAGLEWPAEPHLLLWHAATLLREHRGDGHLVALAVAGLSGRDALVTHCATGRGFTVAAAQRLRGWSPEQWDGAAEGLRVRGLLDAGGALTAAGVALREDVEATTDALAAGPWRALGGEGTARVVELGRALSRVAVAAGAFPDGVFQAAR